MLFQYSRKIIAEITTIELLYRNPLPHGADPQSSVEHSLGNTALFRKKNETPEHIL